MDINAVLNNIKSAGDLANYTMLRTFSHEFVHFIENYNPVWYSTLSAGKYRQYVVFEPNQIKSADPVTYDDDGNVIPLSERFDEAKEDIRYQRRDGRMSDQEVLAYAVDLYKSDASIAEGLTEAEKGALGNNFHLALRCAGGRETCPLTRFIWCKPWCKPREICENLGIFQVKNSKNKNPPKPLIYKGF